MNNPIIETVKPNSVATNGTASTNGSNAVNNASPEAASVIAQELSATRRELSETRHELCENRKEYQAMRSDMRKLGTVKAVALNTAVLMGGTAAGIGLAYGVYRTAKAISGS